MKLWFKAFGIILIYFIQNLYTTYIDHELNNYLKIIVKFVNFVSIKDGQNLLYFILPFYDKSWLINYRPYGFIFNSDFQSICIYEKNYTTISNLLLSYKFIKSIFFDNEIYPRKLMMFKTDSNGIKIPYYLQADLLWSMGIKGQGVKVGIFDTGIEDNHSHFQSANIVEITNWTDEPSGKDTVGHGTFVAGIFASNPNDAENCASGISPEVSLYIFRLFTQRQTSYTSWFLDAFNYALARQIDIINLSIGGPDFQDRPFVEKVWELTANGILLVSASGNDGPLYGTHNNPADQMDVLGVGGIDFYDRLTKFSSRGMTTWEIPQGYGRVKPDIVTYSHQLLSTDHHGGCKSLSGTSVASPTVAAVAALLISAYRQHVKSDRVSPGRIKQALVSSAVRLQSDNGQSQHRFYSMFEQGAGKLNLIGAYRAMLEMKPQVTAYPSYIDFTESGYMWPYSAQPMYSGAMPIIVNVTLINSMGATGQFVVAPQYHAITSCYGHCLNVNITHSNELWPWSGYLAIAMTITQDCANLNLVAVGYVKIIVQSKIANNQVLDSTLSIPIRVKIIPTPPRKKRLLWDQFHNLHYPPGYIPRDDVRRKEPLDWTGDHIHTNFKESFDYLRYKGYFIEVLGSHFECFDANNYMALLLVDLEEEYFNSEIIKLRNDVINKGLSLVVIAEWYNTRLMKHLRFYDENTRQWWTPDTGGSNIPALNELLGQFGILLSDQVVEGVTKIGSHNLHINSGSTLLQFPSSLHFKSRVLYVQEFSDLTSELVDSAKNYITQSAILGMYAGPKTNQSNGNNHGNIAVYSDSNCFDMTHRKNEHSCMWLWDYLLNFASTGHIPLDLAVDMKVVKSNLYKKNIAITAIPVRSRNYHLTRFSKVLQSFVVKQKSNDKIFYDKPQCLNYGSRSLIMDNRTQVTSSWFKPQEVTKQQFAAPMNSPNSNGQSLDKRFNYHKKQRLSNGVNPNNHHYSRPRQFKWAALLLDASQRQGVIQWRHGHSLHPSIYRFYVICLFCCCCCAVLWLFRRLRIRQKLPQIITTNSNKIHKSTNHRLLLLSNASVKQSETYRLRQM